MSQTNILEVRDFLPLGTKATAAVDKARDYLNIMEGLGKTPRAITLFAADYDVVFNGVARTHKGRYKDSDQPPPSIDGLTFRGVPLSRGRAK